ncbi:MAG: hypothetical protein Q9173_006502 [Seirophora scorigena]
MVGKDRRMDDSALIQDPTFGNKDALDKELLHVALSDIPKATLPSARRSSLLASSQGKHKLQRLHPRNFISHRGVDDVVNPVVQPVQTTVASFINVVLDQGGTSVGNVLVPAESTVFNVNGYGPVTLSSAPPARPTPSPQDQNASSDYATDTRASPSGATNGYSYSKRSSAAKPHVYPSLRVQLTGHPFLSSHTFTVESIKFNYFGHRQWIILWLLLISDHQHYPDFYRTKHCFVTICNDLAIAADVEWRRGTTEGEPYDICDSFAVELWEYDIAGHCHPNLKFHHHVTVLFRFLPHVKFSDAEYHIFQFFSHHTTSTISSATASDTEIPGGIGGPTSTVGGAPASTTTAAAGSGGGNAAPTPTIVGSVVGSVAGLALILVLLLFFLRRRKRLGQQRTISPPIPQSASTGPGASTGTMTERSSAAIPLAGAGAGAGFFRRLRPGSGATATTTETTPSERGFQNLGGRKLPSVLSSRGDGFGDVPFGAAGTGATPGASSSRGPPPASIPITTGAPSAARGHSSPESLDGSSFYRDSQGFYGGPAPGPPATEPPSTSSSMFVGPGSPPHSPALPRPEIQLPPSEGVAVMRPGPARTPVTTQPGLSPMRGSPRPQRGTGPPSPHIPGTIQERPRDGLGRSHPSSDGSRSSRFAEDI